MGQKAQPCGNERRVFVSRSRHGSSVGRTRPGTVLAEREEVPYGNFTVGWWPAPRIRDAGEPAMTPWEALLGAISTTPVGHCRGSGDRDGRSAGSWPCGPVARPRAWARRGHDPRGRDGSGGHGSVGGGGRGGSCGGDGGAGRTGGRIGPGIRWARPHRGQSRGAGRGGPSSPSGAVGGGSAGGDAGGDAGSRASSWRTRAATARLEGCHSP
jgi:hypothetical protein